jgi:hypothetical protein
MTNISRLIFAGSIAATAAILILPASSAAAPQIGDDMSKCSQKAHFKDKMCACKDSACAQKVHSPAAAKKGTAPDAVTGNSTGRKKK